MRSKAEITRVLAAALFLLVAACGTAQTRGTQADQGSAEASHPVARATSNANDKSETKIDTATAAALSSTFRAAAHRALPAVVFIQVEKPAGSDGQQGQIPDPFRFFFGNPHGQGGQGGQAPKEEGAGSGFIYDAEGHVITNNHVVSGADFLSVKLVDGREYRAKVVGTDPMSDVAVIKIDPKKGETLPVAHLGDSANLQVGDWVLALGAPFELENTVTAGIVSAKRRQLSGDPSSLQSYIQTDAAINPGNSGGPLVDLEGNVVGINSAILGSPSFVGYGFAIPIDIAKKVASDILKYGHVRRPQLGIQVSDVRAADAEVYHLEAVKGALVKGVQQDSAAAKAGLELGDVIVSVDGQPVEDATELTTDLAQHQPGDTVELSYVRKGETKTVRVKLGEFETSGNNESGGGGGHSVAQILGFQVQSLTPQIAQQLGYSQTSGVVISNVTPFSAAAASGLRSGMLVLQLNGHVIKTPADLESAAKGISSGNVVSLRLIVPNLGETILNYRVR